MIRTSGPPTPDLGIIGSYAQQSNGNVWHKQGTAFGSAWVLVRQGPGQIPTSVPADASIGAGEFYQYVDAVTGTVRVRGRTVSGILLAGEQSLARAVSPPFVDRFVFTPEPIVEATSSLLTDLISYWKLDEGSGTRADSYGTNNLTDNNTVTSASGKLGDAAQFTAANSEYLNITDNASLSMGVGVTMSMAAWVYLDSKGAIRPIIAKDLLVSREYYLFYYHIGDTFRFAVTPTGSPVDEVFVDSINFGSPSTGVWYFVSAWYDGTKIFISVNDGTPDETAYSSDIVNGTADFYLGTMEGAATGLFMDGRIDSAIIAKRAWTGAERTWLYHSDAGREYPWAGGP